MIRRKRKPQYLVYEDSYLRDKPRTSWLKWIVISFIAIACSVFASVVYGVPYANASNQYVTPNQAEAGQLLLETGIPGQYKQVLAVNGNVAFEINGLIATVTLTQSFTNTSAEVAEGLYVFPLPENAAVNKLTMTIGERVIEGRIHEKQQAKALYVAAKAAGKKASLLEQNRPNLFTNSIANIEPNQQIKVTIQYVQSVDFRDDVFSLRFPMTYTQRYTPSDPRSYSDKLTQLTQLEAKSTELKSQRDITNNTPTSPFFVSAQQILSTHNGPSHTMTLSARLNAGVELAAINSPFHAISISQSNAQNQHKITFSKGAVPMDRDFVLTWRPIPSQLPRAAAFTQTQHNEQFTMVMLLPPNQASHASFDKDTTFILDVSGSMQGQSIVQAKQSLMMALDQLTPKDSFNVIAFESQSHPLFGRTEMATPANIRAAKQFVQHLQADGGTEMFEPLRHALSMSISPHQNEQAIRQIVFVTDGAVGNEQALFELIANNLGQQRIFTVGIGSAPNGYFMKKAAQFGRGSYTYINDLNQVQSKMATLLKKINQPLARDISIGLEPSYDFDDKDVEMYPASIPDLYAGEPLMLQFRSASLPDSIRISGQTADNAWHKELPLLASANHKGVSTLWARAKVDSILDQLTIGADKDQVRLDVLDVALAHQIMSPYTSFVAIETTPSVTPSPFDLSQKIANLRPNGQVHSMAQTATSWQLYILISLIMFLSYGLFIKHQKRRGIYVD